jgi:hypothetical protein
MVDGVREFWFEMDVGSNKHLSKKSRIVEQMSAVGATITGDECNVVERRLVFWASEPKFHPDLLVNQMVVAGTLL